MYLTNIRGDFMGSKGTVEIAVMDSSNNAVISFGGNSVWKIYGELEGLNEIRPNIDYVPNMSSIGSKITKSSIGSRVVKFNIVYNSKKYYSEYRDILSKSLKPGIEVYKLRITYINKTLDLKDCVLTDMKLGSGNINDFLRASFTFTALDPLFYDTETTQLFSDSNGSLSFTYRGSAPALPIVDLNVIGAGSKKVVLSINDDVDIIYQPVFDIQATDIVYDFENYNFSPVGVVSFSTDYRKIMIPVGSVNIKANTPCSYSLKFKNRYFGV